MQKNLITIKFIPTILIQTLYKKPYNGLKFAGNIQISKCYAISIIELLNKKRIYMLKHEVNKQN